MNGNIALKGCCWFQFLSWISILSSIYSLVSYDPLLLPPTFFYFLSYLTSSFFSSVSPAFFYCFAFFFFCFAFFIFFCFFVFFFIIFFAFFSVFFFFVFLFFVFLYFTFFFFIFIFFFAFFSFFFAFFSIFFVFSLFIPSA